MEFFKINQPSTNDRLVKTKEVLQRNMANTKNEDKKIDFEKKLDAVNMRLDLPVSGKFSQEELKDVMSQLNKIIPEE